MNRSRKKKRTNPTVTCAKTDEVSISFIDSGRRSKYAVPRIVPAEKATSTKRMPCKVLSLSDKAKMPTSEERLITMAEATMVSNTCFPFDWRLSAW